ncbi:MAG TPA: ribulokinase, partial [Chitinophagaceae bacterium]|nr:ribulokinase [Chitinophagaceae bacterium]
RQHPLDFQEGLERTITGCLAQAGPAAARAVQAISVDTTGSTPVAVDETGTPLSLTPGFESNPNAMFVLWKDHTAVREAEELNAHAGNFPVHYLKYVGGIYSSEWFWAKLLHILRQDAGVRQACRSWVEHCDWIPFLLTGGNNYRNLKRGICAAGHKALWAESFGGYPPEAFFSSWDPLLAGYVSRLGDQTYTADQAAGTLCPAWAARLGLSPRVAVGIGAFDAHMGAVGGQIEPYHLSKVMGTSTCDMLVAPMEEVGDTLVRGICGQVPGSVIPGMMGMEAGQSAFGDTYAWFRDLLLWPLSLLPPGSAGRPQEELRGKLIDGLSEEAAKLDPASCTELSVDWLNGRRTPDADQNLRSALTGMNLGSSAPKLFRALAEGTCFGARAIVDRFVSQGIPVRGLIGIGGVARKSPFIMQMMADTLNMPLRIHRSGQTCAAGAAMFAATVAGIFPEVGEAMKAMGQGFDRQYIPDPSRTGIYGQRYQKYQALGRFIAAEGL